MQLDNRLHKRTRNVRRITIRKIAARVSALRNRVITNSIVKRVGNAQFPILVTSAKIEPSPVTQLALGLMRTRITGDGIRLDAHTL